MNLKNFNAACYSRWPSEIKIVALVLLLVLCSCSSPLYMPSKNNVANTADIEELKSGRKIYVNKCGSCHTLRLPEKFTRTQWTEAMVKMQKKAKISDEEKQLILNYLSKGK